MDKKHKTIAIMGAMTEEIEPLLDIIKDYKCIEYAKNKYYKANYKGLDLIIAYSKIGKVNASLTASVMIEKFGAQSLLFSGVAGAVNGNLKIGDILYATSLAQHDLDISAFGHPYGYVPEGSVFIKTDESLNKIANEVAKQKGINLSSGVIATGDQFICDEQKKQWIKNTFKADAIEMEGASVAVVCDALGVPFFILRAISDGAGMDAEFDFDKFLKTSSQQSADFIVKMIDNLI
ncbi:MAG: 5'-methylthioadenosine/S-adenosylhomocysteine nucleosidase [Proteobacteria bacterium]|nr:MAG: 5'-methylthioadenosine/S-adenosylhomocysteine nucleosidase [Pseudomonadota bacterium]